jgi:predicted nucleic acid-binding protein
VIVADCTIIARLIMGDGDVTGVESLWSRDADWNAPALWEAEFASVLIKYERAGRITPPAADIFAENALRELAESTHHVPISRALDACRRSGCSIYDSYYIALAEDLGVKLYTYDKEILRRCPGLAVKP